MKLKAPGNRRPVVVAAAGLDPKVQWTPAAPDASVPGLNQRSAAGETAVRSHPGKTALQTSLSAWEHGHVNGRELPDPDASPTRLARFFASLTAQQRTRLAHRYPLAVGNMNGAPVTLRYRANHIALDQQREVEKKRMHDNRLTPLGQQEAGRLMHRFEALTAPAGDRGLGPLYRQVLGDTEYWVRMGTLDRVEQRL